MFFTKMLGTFFIEATIFLYPSEIAVKVFKKWILNTLNSIRLFWEEAEWLSG